MTGEINFTTLQNRFKEIKGYYSTENYKYIHVRTIENFLSHADEFFMMHHKQEVYKALSEYLDIIGSKQIDNISESLELFNKYVRPLTTLFSDLRGFHMAPRLWVMIVSTFPVFILLYFLKVSIYFYISLLALITLLAIRQRYFARQQRTYGFMH